MKKCYRIKGSKIHDILPVFLQFFFAQLLTDESPKTAGLELSDWIHSFYIRKYFIVALRVGSPPPQVDFTIFIFPPKKFPTQVKFIYPSEIKVSKISEIPSSFPLP